MPLEPEETEALPLTPMLRLEEAPVLPIGLIGLEETAATPFDFIELTSPKETPVWATGLTRLEGTAASPFVFT